MAELESKYQVGDSMDSCIICGSRLIDCQLSIGRETMTVWRQSSAVALCQLLEINQNHFIPMFRNGSHCRNCFILCIDIDFSLKQLSALESRLRTLKETAKKLIGSYHTSLNAADNADLESSQMLLEFGKEFVDHSRSEYSEKTLRKCRYRQNNLLYEDSESDVADCEENDIEYKLDPDFILDAGDGNALDVPLQPVIQTDNEEVKETSSHQKKKKKRKRKYPAVFGNLTCPVSECKEHFTSPMKLKLHVRIVHDKDPTPYHCEFPTCIQKFDIATDWLNHYDDHKDTHGKYRCIIEGCTKGFKKRRNLTLHLDTRHDPSRKYSLRRPIEPQKLRIRCDICSLSFDGSETEQLTQHEALHLTHTPFSCIVNPCGASFINLTELRLHVGLHHEEIKFLCPSCPDKVFRSQTLLNFHMHKICGRRISDPKVYQCDYPKCGRLLANSTNLQVHMKLHTAQRDHVCDQCGASYKQKKGLVRHKLTSHNKETPHKCLYCVKAFPTVTHLRSHEETHSTKKNFLCSGCGKAFGCKANLRQHATYFCQQRADLSRKQKSPKSKSKTKDREVKNKEQELLMTSSTNNPNEIETSYSRTNYAEGLADGNTRLPS